MASTHLHTNTHTYAHMKYGSVLVCLPRMHKVRNPASINKVIMMIIMS